MGFRVQCFLCSAKIFYGQNDQERLRDHLRSEHSIDTGLDYLVAGCLMNDEEREAIVNVVKDREVGADTDESLEEDVVKEEPEKLE